MSISSTFSRPRGNLIPTGLPIEVADEAARLALTPSYGTRVTQLDTGVTYVFEEEWYPNPALLYATEPSDVATGVFFQSRTHPSATEGAFVANGLPIPVADDDERLSMEPPEGTHVKQASDGMTWVVFEGNWRPSPPLVGGPIENEVAAGVTFQSESFPGGGFSGYAVGQAPVLSADTQPNQVADGVEFQSVSYPNVTYGTLEAVNVTSTSILPAQAWADYIELFVGLGELSVSDSDVASIDANLVYMVYEAQQTASNSCDITLNCSLSSSGVDDILTALAAYPNPVSAGLIELMGSNGAPTKPDAFSLPVGTGLPIAGAYYPYTNDQTRSSYEANATEYPNRIYHITYNYDLVLWEIRDTYFDVIVARSDTNNEAIFPWEAGDFTDGVSIYFSATQLENAAKLALQTAGVTVNTN